MFLNEEEKLHNIHRIGNQIYPEILFVKTTSNNLYLMMQTSIFNLDKFLLNKTTEKKVVDFVLMKQHMNMLFKDTSLLKYLLDSQRKIDFKLDIKSFETFSKSLDYIKNKYSNTYVNTALAHRDLTPWNMKLCYKNLYIYDWEYAKYDWISELDYVHFIIQPLILARFKIPYIVSRYKNADFTVFKSSLDKMDLLRLYCLDMITLYTLRDDIGYNDKTVKMWIELLIVLEDYNEI